MNENAQKVAAICDGTLSSTEIAAKTGLKPRHVRKIMLRHNLPRLSEGARRGPLNHQFVSGRRIDLDGYAMVTAPSNHPNGRHRNRRKAKVICEHRLVMEKKLGRYLKPSEVVDHIDGLSLHNDINNLRLFSSNKKHLVCTISNQQPNISKQGWLNIKNRQLKDRQRVDTYGLRKKRGDVRLRQILLAVLKLGIDSPFLLGTMGCLKKTGIVEYSRSTIKHALGDLYRRWEEDLSR